MPGPPFSPPPFDKDRVTARTWVLESATVLHAHDLELTRRHDHHEETEVALAVIKTANHLWDWLAEVPTKLILLIGVVAEQDDPQPPSGYFYKETTHMAEAVTLTDTQQVPVAVQAVDSKGQPVVDALTWTSDTPDVCGLTVADDGNSALLVAGIPGTASVTVTDGNLSDIIAVSVTAGAAAALQATVGAVVEQPAATPPTDGTVTTPPPTDTGAVTPPTQVG